MNRIPHQIPDSPGDNCERLGTEKMNAITIDQLVKKTSLGRSTIYRMISEGKFPKPFQLVPNRNAWIESDIDAWLAEKAGKAAPVTVTQPEAA